MVLTVVCALLRLTEMNVTWSIKNPGMTDIVVQRTGEPILMIPTRETQEVVSRDGGGGEGGTNVTVTVTGIEREIEVPCAEEGEVDLEVHPVDMVPVRSLIALLGNMHHRYRGSVVLLLKAYMTLGRTNLDEIFDHHPLKVIQHRSQSKKLNLRPSCRLRLARNHR